jgi:molybdopterin converting factor small subunit
MGQVTLRLFGLGKGDASTVHLTRTIEPGTTISVLWESLRGEAPPGGKLATIDPKGVLALLNGRPLRSLAEWDTQVSDDDTVVYMPKAFGG